MFEFESMYDAMTHRYRNKISIVANNGEIVEILDCVRMYDFDGMDLSEEIEWYAVVISVRGNVYKKIVNVSNTNLWGVFEEIMEYGILERRDWYDFKYSFIKAKPTFAMTVHKSQGSTYDKVGVMVSDILNGRCHPDMKNRLMYVALSRAKKQVVVQ